MSTKLIFLLSVFANFTVRQTPVLPKLNAIEANQIIIIDQHQNAYSSGSPKQLIKAFGKTKVVKQADEVLGGFDYTYKYDGFEVGFNGKNWESMSVNGPRCRVKLNGRLYKVGDNISKLKDQFPLSYQNRGYNNSHLMSFHITRNKIVMDTFFTISYNSKGVIASIDEANDNS